MLIRRPNILVSALAIGAAVAWASAARAAITTPKDSSLFNQQINGETTPDAISSTNNGRWSSNGSEIDYHPISGSGAQFGWSDTLSNANGWTVEVRFRITEPHTTGTGVFAVIGSDGSGETGGYQFLRFTASQELFDQGGATGVAILPNPVDFTNGFHTMRMAQAPNEARMTLWLDNQLVVADRISPLTFALNRQWISDYSSTQCLTGKALIDYFRFDTAGSLAPAIPGDFDSDGDVDGADFVAWQTNFPKGSEASLAEGDADADGDVDGADFVVWQTHFPFQPVPGVSPVPEPSGGMLAAFFALGCAGYRWKKWSQA